MRKQFSYCVHALFTPAAVCALLVVGCSESEPANSESASTNTRQSAEPQAPRGKTTEIPANVMWQNVEDDVGKKWDEVNITKYMNKRPADIDTGEHIVVFYAMDCDHCQGVFEDYFANGAPAPTTMVAVPQQRSGFPPESERLDMPCPECEQMKLPVGPTWFFTPPIVLRVEDGVVTCAASDDKGYAKCLQ